MPFSEKYEIKYGCIIFHYKNILCLNESNINCIEREYNFIFYDTEQDVYFDYGGLKKMLDKYRIEDWIYFEDDNMLYILAIRRDTKQTTVIEIDVDNCLYTEKEINISIEDVEDRDYFIIYNGEEACLMIKDKKDKSLGFYNYNRCTYGLNIRDISITGVIRNFYCIYNYENRIVILLEGKNIKIFDQYTSYLSHEKRLSVFLDICFDKKSINIINDKGINKDTYIEDWNFKDNKLFFSENPYKGGNCSGLERYYFYDIENKQLKELNVGNKCIPCFGYEGLYISELQDDREILRLSDMKTIYREDVFNTIKKINQEISDMISWYNAEEELKWVLKHKMTEWWYYDYFIEVEGLSGQKILIEIDTMKYYVIWEHIVEIIGDTVYVLENPV